MIRQAHYKAVLCLALLVSGFATYGLGRDATTLNLSRAAHVGASLLEPGEYRVSWQPDGAGLNVTFSLKGAAVASSAAKIEPRNEKFSRTSVLYRAQPDGSQRITEIRLAGKREAIVLGS